MASVSETNLKDPMDVNSLNQDEKAALNELKHRFAGSPIEYVHDERYLLHWLKARRFDVDKAESMLRCHLRYRKSLNMDSPAYKNFPVNPVMDAYYTRGQIGHDKMDRPVVYFPFGGIDPKGILSSVRHSEAIKTVAYWIEERRWSCQEISNKIGRPISQVVYIIDLKGIGVKHLWKPGIDAFKQLSELMQLHAPEMIYKLFVVNAPNIFYTIYKLIKPVLDENTQRKINVYGENFKDALLTEIDADQLPVYYGGTLVGPDGDPKVSQEIKYGGEVPVEMYFDESKCPPPEKLHELTIKSGKESLIPVVVEKPMTELRWYFKNESSNDIGFGIYKKLDETQNDVSEMDMIVPYARLFTLLVPEWGQITLKEPGTYLVQFDNSYSWIQNKHIKYSIVQCKV